MLWKKEKNGIQAEKQLVVMNELLKRSFGNVKRDTANIFQWLQYLYQKNLEQEQAMRRMQVELSYMPKTREEIRRIVDDYYSFESVISKVLELNLKVEELSKARP